MGLVKIKRGVKKVVTYTEKFNLAKPDLYDSADITVINDNMDKLDKELGVCKKNKTKIIETSQNWTVPDGVREVLVYLIGGGGGGSNESYRGGGGGFAATELIKVTPGEVIPIIIGAGGAGGNENYYKGDNPENYHAYGYNGGSSKFGNYLTCQGGTGGDNTKIMMMNAAVAPNACSAGSGGAGGSFKEDGFGGSGIGTNGEGANYGSGMGGIAICGSYKGAFCTITGELYGGGGGGGMNGIGGAGGGGNGGKPNCSYRNPTAVMPIKADVINYEGQDGQLYGAGGGGGEKVFNTATGNGKPVGGGGNGHDGVCIIAY